MVDEANLRATYGENSAVIKAADAAVEQAVLEAEYKVYADVLNADVAGISAIYADVMAYIKSSEEAVAKSEKAVADLLAKWDALKNNPNATERELARAEQFYNIGVEELTAAKANLAKIVEIAEKINKDYLNSDKVLDIKVVVFGNSTIDSNLSSAVQGADKFATDMAGDLNAKPARAPMYDIINNYYNAKVDYADAKAKYDAAKAEYDALKALDWSTLTEEENSANKSRLLVCAFNMARAEKEMADAQQPKNCIKCGKCEQACPQKIAIREDLEKVQVDLDKREMIL